VRIFLAEKGLSIPQVPVDLGKGEQHSEAYRAINPRRVVPTLVLEDDTAIGEVPAIMRYLDEAFPEKPLLGTTPKDKALIAMWERRAELEGFAAVMEGVRNKIAGLKGRAIAGPHDYEQIPALVERSVLRVKNFFADLNERPGQVPFVAGECYSAADITAQVTVDFAKALELSVPADHAALKRWYETVSSRPSAAARSLGASAGIGRATAAVLSLLIGSHVGAFDIETLDRLQTLATGLATRLQGSGAAHNGAVLLLDRSVRAQAYTLAYADGMALCVGVAIATLLLVLSLRKAP
jgi:glutathione S-transferase